MVLDRQTVAARQASPADARRLVDLNITAAGVIQQRGNALLESGARSVGEAVSAAAACALTDATYGVGLLGEREREAAVGVLGELLAAPQHSPPGLHRASCGRPSAPSSGRRATPTLAFAEVWAPWTFLLPQTASIRDDILRSSPLLLYAQVARRLDDYAAGAQRTRHDLFGTEVDTDVRALNPGLALGTAAGRAEGRRVHPRRDRRAARDARRPRSGRRHPHPGRGQRPVARAAAGARARDSQRRARPQRLPRRSRRTTDSRSSSSSRPAGASSSRRPRP